MYGRYGVDNLSKDMLIPFIVIVLIANFTTGVVRIVINVISWIFLGITYYRVFSKNIVKRQSENAWYLSKKKYIKQRISQRKQYKFFDCPKCHTHLRIPRGVGEVTITCKNCGHKFDGKA